MKRSSVILTTILLLAIITLLAGIVYLIWWKPAPATDSNGAGNNTAQSNNQNNPQPQTPGTRSYTSQKGVTILLDNWVDSNTVTSPLTVTGKVPGNWSFEASFPIELQSSSGNTLVKTPATLTGDWTTTDLVPFTATLTFDSAAAGDTGSLILHKDNPSGLAEKDDTLTLNIKFK